MATGREDEDDAPVDLGDDDGSDRQKWKRCRRRKRMHSRGGAYRDWRGSFASFSPTAEGRSELRERGRAGFGWAKKAEMDAVSHDQAQGLVRMGGGVTGVTGRQQSGRARWPPGVQLLSSPLPEVEDDPGARVGPAGQRYKAVRSLCGASRCN